MPRQKTASVEQYHASCTQRHYLNMTYGGYTCGPLEPAGLPGHRVRPALVVDDAAGIQQMRDHAKATGFTHIRFVGEWSGTKPKGGKL
jgi:hypothetical protein